MSKKQQNLTLVSTNTINNGMTLSLEVTHNHHIAFLRVYTKLGWTFVQSATA